MLGPDIIFLTLGVTWEVIFHDAVHSWMTYLTRTDFSAHGEMNAFPLRKGVREFCCCFCSVWDGNRCLNPYRIIPKDKLGHTLLIKGKVLQWIHWGVKKQPDTEKKIGKPRWWFNLGWQYSCVDSGLKMKVGAWSKIHRELRIQCWWHHGAIPAHPRA